MARIHLVIPDEDRERFVNQARKEGMTLSAWLRTAARQQFEKQKGVDRFEPLADLEEFFRACDALHGPEPEPSWEEHLAVINKSRSGVSVGT